MYWFKFWGPAQLVDISKQQLTYLKAMAGATGNEQTMQFPY
jgi:hypothetical protein